MNRCPICGARRSDIGVFHAKDCHVSVMRHDLLTLRTLNDSATPDAARIVAHQRRAAWLMTQLLEGAS